MKKFLKYIFGGILFLLGFGCDKEGFGIGGGYCMYGQPHADYKLIGDVKGQDGKPIQGIRVVFTPDPASYPYNNDTLYTDAKGHFQSDRLKYDFPNVQKANVIFEDATPGGNIDDPFIQTLVMLLEKNIVFEDDDSQEDEDIFETFLQEIKNVK